MLKLLVGEAVCLTLHAWLFRAGSYYRASIVQIALRGVERIDSDFEHDVCGKLRGRPNDPVAVLIQVELGSRSEEKLLRRHHGSWQESVARHAGRSVVGTEGVLHGIALGLV